MKGAKEKSIKSTCTTRSLVVVGREYDKDDGIEQLLLFNNLSQEVKDQFPYTGYWFFVLFHPTGEITQQMILGMMENQNYFLETQISIAVQGFKDIETMVDDMEVSPADELDASMEGLEPPEVMLIVWILWKRVLDGSKLVTSKEQGP
eukprot:890353-Ditylum_brightwellii.AAC.1